MIAYRRRLLAAGLALPVAAQFSRTAMAQSCAGTLSQTEGPFFKTQTPQRASFLEKDSRTRLVVSGQVLSAQCRPVPNALLEFWHADEFGEYDNTGYRHRGHQHADAQGRYRLEPLPRAARHRGGPAARGPPRTNRAKAQAPGRLVLTTQLACPSEPGNRRGSIYR